MKLCISFFLSILLFFSLQSTSAQEGRVLNVPYVYQVHPCCWCWAAANNMVINYYGNNVELCEVVEYARTLNPSRFGTQNCCNIPTPTLCINSNYISSTVSILNNWGISNDYIYDVYSMNEIQTEINGGRPWIYDRFESGMTHGHTLVGRGYHDGNVYIVDPFDGYHVYTYDWIVDNGTQMWEITHRLFTNPSCIDITLIYTNSINSDLTSTATYDIDCSSTIGNNSDVIFRAGHEIILQAGFTVNQGSSLELSASTSYGCN